MPPTFYKLLSLNLRVDGVLSRRPLPPDTTEEHLAAPGSPVEPLANSQIRYSELGRRGMLRLRLVTAQGSPDAS